MNQVVESWRICVTDHSSQCVLFKYGMLEIINLRQLRLWELLGIILIGFLVHLVDASTLNS